MKTLSSVLALFLCVFGGVSSARGQAVRQPVKNANVVLIQTPDSAAVALRKLATVFVAQGYTVDKLDREFLTLTLAPKTLQHTYNPILVVRACASKGANSVVKISGDYKANAGTVQVASQAEYAGSDTGTNKTAFEELRQAALAYPAGKVSYAKQ